ncbi:MAG: Gfo/Idh/MocA family protein [Granulosicoccus sp.]
MKICLVGIGKIAVDQHVPALMASNDWKLDATVSRSGTVDGVTSFTDFDTFLAENDAPVVSLCLPPVPRYDYAAKAIAAGRHVMLEKPPGATLAEVHALERKASDAGVVLFATWHSRMAAGVAGAKSWLADKRLETLHITWREDVRKWHPGQDWVFAPGGMGVFDPGINALSIMTEILPQPVFLRHASLDFPENRDTPIAADLTFSNGVTADFDWRQEGPQTWAMRAVTNAGVMDLTDGGSRLIINDQPIDVGPNREYPALYDRMASCVQAGMSDVDLTPMVHVADAMTLGRRTTVAAFDF